MRVRERLARILVGLLVTTMLLGGGYQATNLRDVDVNGDGGVSAPEGGIGVPQMRRAMTVE